MGLNAYGLKEAKAKLARERGRKVSGLFNQQEHRAKVARLERRVHAAEKSLKMAA